MECDTAYQTGRNLPTFWRDLLRQDLEPLILKAAPIVSFHAIRKLYQFIRRQFQRQYCSSWHVFEGVCLQLCGPSAFVTVLQNFSCAGLPLLWQYCRTSVVRAFRFCDSTAELQRIKLVQKIKILTSGSVYFEFSTVNVREWSVDKCSEV